MSGHEIPPAVIAQADQERALTGENVTRMVAAYRSHVGTHGGDTLCAWAVLGARVVVETDRNPIMLADLVAGCVDRIAKLEQELGR